VIRSHPRELLELLMRVSAGVLLDLAANPRWLGGMPGATALLHTWTRQGIYHPHVHIIATGGGLDEHGRWHQPHPKFLVPVQALSRVFRARLHDAMREQYPELLARVDPKAWSLPVAGSGHHSARAWVVHSKPVGSGEKTLTYLSRYVYRVALSEHAILGRAPDGRYIIRYRKSGSSRPRMMRLQPHELIRRFLQHVLPSGFRKIRYFGLHHSSKRPVLRLLQAAMAMRLGQPLPEAPEVESYVPACPDCQAPMVFEERIAPSTHLAFAATAGLNRGPPG